MISVANGFSPFAQAPFFLLQYLSVHVKFLLCLLVCFRRPAEQIHVKPNINYIVYGIGQTFTYFIL